MKEKRVSLTKNGITIFDLMFKSKGNGFAFKIEHFNNNVVYSFETEKYYYQNIEIEFFSHRMVLLINDAIYEVLFDQPKTIIIHENNNMYKIEVEILNQEEDGVKVSA